jgi:predicted Zn-dependent protease
MNEVPAIYFDGRTSQPRQVTVRWHAFDSMLEVSGNGVALRVPQREVTVESRLGRGPRFIRFTDGGRCEVADNAGLDAVIESWASNRGGAWLNRVENSWLYVMLAVLMLTVIGWAAIQFGLPWGARKIAFMLPASTTRQLGDQTLAALDRTMFKPTKLTHERQLALQAEFKRFLAIAGDAEAYNIEFRSAKEMGANALALPSGTIIITDELVMLAEDDREILGVLAHECGHIQHRHALRGVLQNSAVFVVIALVTGDVSSATAFGGALPTFLLQTRFSREFEREADAHAIVTLRAAKIDPEYLARMLERLGKEHSESLDEAMGYIGSHPPTKERINTIKGAR